MKGISLVETVVGAGIISIVLLGLGAVAQLTLNSARVSTQRLEAAFLASEGVEAEKSMRDGGWAANIVPLGTTTTYYLLYDSGYSATSTEPARVDGVFKRSFAVGEVFRDTNFDIASSGTLVYPHTDPSISSQSGTRICRSIQPVGACVRQKISDSRSGLPYCR